MRLKSKFLISEKNYFKKYYYLECSVNTFHLNWKLSLRFEANKGTLTVINIGIVASDHDPIYDIDLKHWLPTYHVMANVR